VELALRAVKNHELGDKMCVSESSLSYSESCGCDFVQSRSSVGGVSNE